MGLLTFTLLIVAIYAGYYYLKRKRAVFEEQGLPCIGWPFFSNIIVSLLVPISFADSMKMVYNAFPNAKYIGIFDFMRPMIVVRDLELIKSITVKNFENFPNHVTYFDFSIDKLFGDQLFNTTGERWKQTRNMFTPAFTASKMRSMHELIVECARNFVGYLNELPVSDRKMIGTKELFSRFTNDAIATSAFGISVDSLKNPQNEFYTLGKKVTNFDGIIGIRFVILNMFPILAKLFNIKLFDRRASEFFEDVVRTTMKLREEKGISRPDMIQLMMKTRESGVKLDVSQMTAHAFSFFFGGFDTISTLSSAMAHELAINPKVQKCLQDEIEEVMKRRHGYPTYEDIHAMQYLDAAFNETMRKHPPVITLDRMCVKDFELPPALPGGESFTIRKGMGVYIPVTAIHRDPNYFENPDEFDPSRYLGKKAALNDVTSLGFGIGPRSCIGNRFAAMNVKILFTYLLSEFNLVPNAKTCSPYTYSWFSFNVRPPGGFWLDIEPRNSK